MNQITCQQCRKPVDQVKITRHHAAGYWILTVICHGEAIEVKQGVPPAFTGRPRRTGPSYERGHENVEIVNLDLQHSR